MTQKRRIEMAFEIARAFICGERWRDSAEWCDGCESYVPMVTTLAAATLDETTSAEIFRRVEATELHHKLTADATLLVCLSSLLYAGENSPIAETAF